MFTAIPISEHYFELCKQKFWDSFIDQSMIEKYQIEQQILYTEQSLTFFTVFSLRNIDF